MSEWLNTQTIIAPEIEKPCHKLGWCPYGQLVEEFPLREERDEHFSCTVYGHDCPAFYHAEGFAEERAETDGGV